MSHPTGQRPNGTATDDRDWIAEARRILTSETMLLPERGHLAAVQAQANELSKIVALQNRALIAMFLELKRSGMEVPAATIAQIEAAGLDLAIDRQAGGPLTVRLLKHAPIVRTH